MEKNFHEWKKNFHEWKKISTHGNFFPLVEILDGQLQCLAMKLEMEKRFLKGADDNAQIESSEMCPYLALLGPNTLTYYLLWLAWPTPKACSSA